LNSLKEVEAFKALSSGDKWRVRRSVYLGKTPDDPRMALAAVELAEGYQRQGHMRLVRWGAIVMVAFMVPAAIYAAVSGRALEAVLWGLIALAHAGQLLFNPATRPKNVTRSLEASRRMLGAT
jgi:hypothetical protein